jgi:hypothetical protein
MRSDFAFDIQLKVQNTYNSFHASISFLSIHHNHNHPSKLNLCMEVHLLKSWSFFKNCYLFHLSKSIPHFSITLIHLFLFLQLGLSASASFVALLTKPKNPAPITNSYPFRLLSNCGSKTPQWPAWQGSFSSLKQPVHSVFSLWFINHNN